MQNFDICIIGAGAAGIALAMELAKTDKKVALCDGGGFDFSDDSQELYAGIVEGGDYFPLESTRLRYFGGSTNHWGGWCRPLDDFDFNRIGLGESHLWPIERSDLQPYLVDASKILEIEGRYSEIHSIFDSNIDAIEIEFSPPTQFGRTYRKQILDSENIQLFLEHNFVSINSAERAVKDAVFVSLSGEIVKIKAKKFVVACGGIENSRILLNLRESQPKAFLSPDLPIGKYWMEHYELTVGTGLIDSSIRDQRFFAVNYLAQKNSETLGCGFRVEDHKGPSKQLAELLCIAPNYSKALVEKITDKQLLCEPKIIAFWEQEPNANSQLTLDKNHLDRLGVPRVCLNWDKSELDIETLRTGIYHFAEMLIKSNKGRYKSLVDLNSKSNLDKKVYGSHHHMGGTRMGVDPRVSVVDSNLKVHGVDNLYVTGSSVFTTSGISNPTLTIIQLSLRLASYLESI